MPSMSPKIIDNGDNTYSLAVTVLNGTNDTALLTSIDARLATANTTLTSIANSLATLVTNSNAIKAKADQLTFNGTGKLNVNAL